MNKKGIIQPYPYRPQKALVDVGDGQVIPYIAWCVWEVRRLNAIPGNHAWTHKNGRGEMTILMKNMVETYK